MTWRPRTRCEGVKLCAEHWELLCAALDKAEGNICGEKYYNAATKSDKKLTRVLKKLGRDDDARWRAALIKQKRLTPRKHRTEPAGSGRMNR